MNNTLESSGLASYGLSTPCTQHKVTVIDSIMGSGKTSHFIEYINRLAMYERTTFGEQRTKWIYVTPSLSEVDRVTSSCTVLGFLNPVPVSGRKYWHFKSLVEAGENICTTHALFRKLDRSVQAELKKQGYRLVIDESLETVEIFTGLSPDDLKTLIKYGWIVIDSETGILSWVEAGESAYQGQFEHIRELCLNGSLVARGDKLLLWEFPVSFLDCFMDTHILTYLYHGSVMSSYLAAGGVKVEMKAVHGDRLVAWGTVNEGQIKQRLRSLIKVYEGRCNRVGDIKPKQQTLSASWYKRVTASKTGEIAILRANLESFFKCEAKTPSPLNLWTTFKTYQGKLAGKGYTKGWIPNNTRATNDFKSKVSAAYCCNTFMHPVVSGYLESRSVPVYEELYALSEMIQWIWRTAIREFQPIQLFIPSERMRNLFQVWLQSDTSAELWEKLGLGQINHLKAA